MGAAAAAAAPQQQAGAVAAAAERAPAPARKATATAGAAKSLPSSSSSSAAAPAAKALPSSSALAAAPAAPVAPPQARLGNSPSCRTLSVATAFTASADAATKALTLNGTVTVTNSGPFVVAISRVGTRLCGSRASEHVRVEARCPGDDAPAGGSLVCALSLALPPPPAPGSKLRDWSGVLSSAELAMEGERCPSAVVDPVTLRPDGTCVAAGG